MAAWTSWGAVPHIFDEADERLADERAELRGLVSDAEWESAKRTTLNAHYTAEPITAAIWDQLGQAGFTSGRVLEPGSGVGTFIGAAPEGADMVGVELDETTAKISSLLYPEAQIHAQGFEETRFPESSFDAVVGNVPFGSFSVHDRRHNPNNHSIHNHFIIKSLRQTAPGGYVAVISSAYTLGSRNSKARDEMARYGDLVGAVRLPEGTFGAAAGTSVSTDVLVFRRRDPAAAVDTDETDRWVKPSSKTVQVDGEEVSVEWPGYYAHHPENVVGVVRGDTDQFGNPTAKVVRDGLSVDQVAVGLDERLNRIVNETEHRYDPAVPPGTVVPAHAAGLHLAQQAEARVGHTRMVTEAGKKRLERYSPDLTWEPVKPAGVKLTEAGALLELRDLARGTVAAQAAGDTETAEDLRDRLSTSYQRYYDQHTTKLKDGTILRGVNRRKDQYRAPSQKKQSELVQESVAQWRQDNNVEADVEPSAEVLEEFRSEAAQPTLSGTEQPHLRFLQGDPDLGLLMSVEHYDPDTGTAQPAAIQQRDVVGRQARLGSAETVEDAVAVSMDETRRVEPARVAELLGIDEDQAREQLRGHAFTDPATGAMTSAPQYLAGNVRQKLDLAHQAARNEPETYGANVAALEEVVPADIDLDDVRVAPGARWIPQEYHIAFARELFQAEDLEVFHNRPASSDHAVAGQDKWEVKAPARGYPDHIRYEFGIPKHRRTPHQIMELALNNSPVRFTTENDEGRRVVNEAATQAGRDKIEKIRTRFTRWVSEDPERKAVLQDRYNELFNSVVPADYSQAGQALRLPGLAADRTPYSYQRSAVARVVNEPATMLDHVVGAGKTGTMVMSAMELRRTGQANKPAMVVPNHLVDQISTEFRQWYPTANVLAIPTGLNREQKSRWIAQAAGGDWDCVVIPQTTFEAIPIDPERRAGWLEDEIAAAEAHAREVAESKGGGSAHVKQTQAAAQRLRKQHQADSSAKFDGISFEQTGIDYLMVDEAHHYKNLARQAELAELGHSGSKRARDLDHKLRTMREFKIEEAQRAGADTRHYVPAVATFATGTPVANSMSELWVMQKYLRPDLLEATQLSSVDAWATQFTEAETRMQLSVTGDSYEPKTKVGRYINTPELAEMNRMFTDRVTPADLEVPIPAVAGGQRHLLTRQPSGEVGAYTDELVERVEALRRGQVDPTEDNMLKLSSDARKVALDPRSVGLAADDDGGKIGQVADQIERIHTDTHQKTYTAGSGEPSTVPGGLQIVFCDQGTPGNQDFDAYQGLKDELVARGIESEKIAFIHDASDDVARAELFAACRDGAVSVLIGSTQKMGTGANIQNRATALHHVDVPWRPADLEQREGRLLRQGNQNQEVEILAYGTEKTFDVRSWDIVAHKARFISQWKSGMVTDRDMDDPIPALEFSAAEAAAVLTGDPRIQQREDLNLRIRELKTLEEAHQQNNAFARREMRIVTDQITYQHRTLPALEQLASTTMPTAGDSFVVTTDQGQRITDRAEAGERLLDMVKAEAFRRETGDYLDGTEAKPFGTLGGVELTVNRRATRILIGTGIPGVQAEVGVSEVQAGNVTARGLISRAEHLVNGLDDRAVRMAVNLEAGREKVAELEASQSGEFPRAGELSELEDEFARLDAEINGTDLDDDTGSAPEPLTGDALRRIYPSREDKLTRNRVAGFREGDLIKQKSRFLAVAHVADDPEAGHQEQFYLYDPDDHPARPSNNELASGEFSPLFAWDEVELVSRDYQALTGWEQRIAEVDPETDRVETMMPAREYPAGTRVSLPAVGGTEPVTAYIAETEVRASGVARKYLDADGAVLERLRDYQAGAAVIHDIGDIITEDRRAAAERAAEQAKLRYPRRFLPGEVLNEDIENFGDHGDVVATTGFGHQRVAVDPATGQARDYRGWPSSGEYDTTEPRMLTDQEIRRLYGTDGPLHTTASALRPGDVVEAQQIHTQGRQGHRVQVTGVSGGNMATAQTEIDYQDTDGGATTTGKKKAGTEVEVHQRLAGALTGSERAHLVWPEHPQLRLDELNPQQEGRRVVVMADNQLPVAGTVVSVNHHQYRGTEVDVATDDRGRLDVRDESTPVIITDQQLNLADLYATEPPETVSDAPTTQRPMTEPERQAAHRDRQTEATEHWARVQATMVQTATASSAAGNSGPTLG